MIVGPPPTHADGPGGKIELMALPLLVVTDEADVYRNQQHEDQGLHEPNEHFQKIER